MDLDLDDPALPVSGRPSLRSKHKIDLKYRLLKMSSTCALRSSGSHRDLALALSRRGESRTHRYQSPVDAQSLADMERAMALLHHVVMSKWDRFAEIEVIALTELNRLFGSHGRRNGDQSRKNLLVQNSTND